MSTINFNGCKSYPGFEQFLGKLITERSNAKKPIQNIIIKGLRELNLYKAIPHPILVTPAEELKEFSPYETLKGFSMSIYEIGNQPYEKLGEYGLFYDMESLRIFGAKGLHFNWLDIFKTYKNLKLIDISSCDLPKE